MEPKRTANSRYNYSKNILGRTLHEWVQDANKYNSKVNKWKIFPLKKGSLGYDNIAMSLMAVFNKLDDDPQLLGDEDKICQLMHRGWTENYTYWRDNEPYKKDKSKYEYRKPSQKLGDERRDKISKMQYSKLSDDEKEKNKVFYKFIVENLEITYSDSE